MASYLLEQIFKKPPVGTANFVLSCTFKKENSFSLIYLLKLIFKNCYPMIKSVQRGLELMVHISFCFVLMLLIYWAEAHIP